MFRCVVSNVAGSATSNAARLTVTTDQPPTGTITQPAVGATYAGGDTIAYAGTATDNEDGTLPPSAFTWQVDFHHDIARGKFFLYPKRYYNGVSTFRLWWESGGR